MKPFGRERKVKFPCKRDCHPKKGWVNWWETIWKPISRKTMKQKVQSEIKSILP